MAAAIGFIVPEKHRPTPAGSVCFRVFLDWTADQRFGKLRRVKTWLLVPLLGALALSAASGQVTGLVYQQTFDNLTGANILADGNQTFAKTFHWAVHETGNGSFHTVNNMGASPTNSAPDSGAAKGFFYDTSYGGFSDATLGRMLAWTWDIAATNVFAAQLTSVAWYQGNADATTTNRVALRINGQWYVSSNGFTQVSGVPTGNQFGGLAESKTFNFAGAAWQLLNFDGGTNTSGSVLGLGAGASLPAGAVEAIGLYIDRVGPNVTTRRFDSFQVYAVIPEPGTGWLTVVGLAGLVAWRRRCR